MSRIENAINLVNDVMEKSDAWIIDNGNISDNVIVADIRPILNELKEYEINVNDKFIEGFFENNDIVSNNTYNWSSPISNDFVYHYLNTSDGCIMIMAVHLFGDIRANYTDYFALKFDSIEEFYDLETMYQTISINDIYSADICVFSEGYSVYDYEKSEDIGEFYEIDKKDLLKEISEMN